VRLLFEVATSLDLGAQEWVEPRIDRTDPKRFGYVHLFSFALGTEISQPGSPLGLTSQPFVDIIAVGKRRRPRCTIRGAFRALYDGYPMVEEPGYSAHERSSPGFLWADARISS
jgi:hypothetical protein